MGACFVLLDAVVVRRRRRHRNSLGIAGGDADITRVSTSRNLAPRHVSTYAERRPRVPPFAAAASSEEERTMRTSLQRLMRRHPPEKVRFRATWRTMLERLEQLGVVGNRLFTLLNAQPALLELDPSDTLIPFVRTLSTVLEFDEKGTAILFNKRPSLLLHPEVAIAEVLSLLLSLQISEKQLRFVVLRYPGLIELNPKDVRERLIVLRREARLDLPQLSALVRRSPWVLCYDVATEMRTSLAFLGAVDVRNTPLVVQTEPRVFGCSSQQLNAAYNFIRRLGVSARDLSSLLQLFPTMLLASVDNQMQVNVDFIRALGVSFASIARMVRAFPQLLVLSREEHMEPMVRFLRDSGLREEFIARIVVTLPPLLSYDVYLDVRPRLRFAERVGVSVDELGRFPAFFSYPLYETIVPRLAFLRSRGVKIASVGLSQCITCTEEQFCERVAMVEMERYRSFCGALMARRSASRAQQAARGDRALERTDADGGAVSGEAALGAAAATAAASASKAGLDGSSIKADGNGEGSVDGDVGGLTSRIPTAALGERRRRRKRKKTWHFDMECRFPAAELQ